MVKTYKEMDPTLKNAINMTKDNILFNLLKTLAVISFFFIAGFYDYNYFFLVFLLQLPAFFINLINFDFGAINKYELITFFILLNLIVFISSKRYKNKYSFILCFLSLLFSITYINVAEFSKFPDDIPILNPFSVSISIFILLSIGVIILNLKKSIKM